MRAKKIRGHSVDSWLKKRGCLKLARKSPR